MYSKDINKLSESMLLIEIIRRLTANEYIPIAMWHRCLKISNRLKTMSRT